MEEGYFNFVEGDGSSVPFSNNDQAGRSPENSVSSSVSDPWSSWYPGFLGSPNLNAISAATAWQVGIDYSASWVNNEPYTAGQYPHLPVHSVGNLGTQYDNPEPVKQIFEKVDWCTTCNPMGPAVAQEAQDDTACNMPLDKDNSLIKTDSSPQVIQPLQPRLRTRGQPKRRGGRASKAHGTERLRCQDCTKTFDLPCALKKHRKIHERPEICRFCPDVRWADNSALKRHYRSRHREYAIEIGLPVDYTCQVSGCSRNFNRLDNLKRHYKRKHGNVYAKKTDGGDFPRDHYEYTGFQELVSQFQ